MTTTGYKSFFEGMFNVFGTPPPEFPEHDGVITVDLDLDGVKVPVLHFPERNPDYVFALVPFGLLAPELQEAAVLGMMDANFTLMTHEFSATYSCNPLTGEFFLQCAFPLAGGDPKKILGQIEIVSRLAGDLPATLARQATEAAAKPVLPSAVMSSLA